MSHCLDYDKTRLGPYIAAAAVETEERIARLHLIIGVLGCVFSVLLVTGGMLPLMVRWGIRTGTMKRMTHAGINLFLLMTCFLFIRLDVMLLRGNLV